VFLRYLVKEETGKIASFYLNVVCSFNNEHKIKENITWSVFTAKIPFTVKTNEC